MTAVSGGDLRALRTDPFALLSQLDARYSRGSESAAAAEETWAGLTVRVSGETVLIPQSDIREIRDVPGFTRAPLAKSWLLGLANVRGDLLALVDLGQWFTAQPSTLTLESRLLVLNHPELAVGFLVDRVEGMRRYRIDERRPAEIEAVPVMLRPHLVGGFERENQVRNVLSLRRLAADAEFRSAAG